MGILDFHLQCEPDHVAFLQRVQFQRLTEVAAARGLVLEFAADADAVAIEFYLGKNKKPRSEKRDGRQAAGFRGSALTKGKIEA